MTLRSSGTMRRAAAAIAALALAASACTLDNTPETVTLPPGVTSPVPPETTTTAPPPPPTTLVPPTGDAATIVHVIDGDSMVVSVGGAEEEVRLLGINAPEADECVGAAAREALAPRLEGGGEVVLVATAGPDRDEFGRLLRYVFAGETNLNAAQVRNGFALALSFEHERRAQYERAEEEAVAERLGMWSPTACGEAPRVALEVAITFDPPGPDDEDLNGEFVAITNVDTNPVDLSGWKLRDESSSNRFEFPDGAELGPRGTLTVRVGCGTDTRAELFWCAGQPVWSNSGDTALLLDPNGSVVVRAAY